MKTAIALRHVHFEDLGTLEPVLKERGYAVQYIDASIDDLRKIDSKAADIMIVLGGPIGAFDEATYPFLSDELALIEQRLQCQRPILGICLGAQLMARAAGAKVYSMGVKEIGFSPLSLSDAGRSSALAALGDTPVLHWHGDQFDIPAGAVRLAGTAVCPHQAFSLNEHALGLQFHLEANMRKIEHWLVGHAGELSACNIDPRTLRTQADVVQKSLTLAAWTVFSQWLDNVERT